jgi:hypothetical protein
MSKVTISAATLAKVKQYINDVTPPGEGIVGNPLVDQALAALFGEGATKEVELIDISFDTAPTPRFKMVGEQKNIASSTGKFQLRGLATIQCEGITSKIMMHAHTAACFAKSNKVVLRGRTGDISSGQNKDKKWLSLTPETMPSTDDVLAFLESATVPTAVGP